MRNITVAVNDKTYRDIRVWCAQRDTSVSAVVQAFLEDLSLIKHAPRFPLPDARRPKNPRPAVRDNRTAPAACPQPDRPCQERSRPLPVS